MLIRAPKRAVDAAGFPFGWNALLGFISRWGNKAAVHDCIIEQCKRFLDN
jgi:hypothetical protein